MPTTSGWCLAGLAVIAAQLIPSFSSPARAAAVQDSVITGICECGPALAPIGIVAPEDGFQAGCSTLYVLKYGSGDGARGTYGLLDLPPCPVGPCATKGNQDRLECEIASGYGCVPGPDFVGKEMAILPGSKTGPFLRGITNRWYADTDQRQTCYSQYVGNGSRVLHIVVLEPFSVNGRKSVRAAGFAAFFIHTLPTQSGDDLVGELVVAPTP